MNMKKSGLILILVIAFSSAFAYSTNAAELLVESDSSVQPRIIMCSCGGRTAPESIFKCGEGLYCSRTNGSTDGMGQTITYYYCQSCGALVDQTATEKRPYCWYLHRYYTLGAHP